MKVEFDIEPELVNKFKIMQFITLLLKVDLMEIKLLREFAWEEMIEYDTEEKKKIYKILDAIVDVLKE